MLSCTSPDAAVMQTYGDSACTQPAGEPQPVPFQATCETPKPDPAPSISIYSLATCVRGSFVAPTSGLVYAQYDNPTCGGDPIPTTQYPTLNKCFGGGNNTASMLVTCNATDFAVMVYAGDGCVPGAFLSNMSMLAPIACTPPVWSPGTGIIAKCYDKAAS